MVFFSVSFMKASYYLLYKKVCQLDGRVTKEKWHYPWYEMLMVIATTVKNWEVIILVCSKHLKEKAYEWAKGECRCKEKK